MTTVQSIIKRAVEEAGQLSNRSTGDLVKEVSSRLPANAEIKLYKGKMRVSHSFYFDNLFTAEAVDEALAANAALFG